MEAPNQEHKPNTMLLLIGGILMVLGVIVLVSSSWSSFSATGRMITVALPLIGLYVMSALSWRRPTYHTIGHYALLTSSAMLPFVTGVLIYQSGLYTTVDAQLVLYCSVFSLIVAATLEFILRQREQVVFTLISVIAAVISLTNALQFSSVENAWLALAIGVLLLIGGIALQQDNEKMEAFFFCSLGFLGFIAGLGLLPILYSNTTSWSTIAGQNSLIRR